MVVSLRLRERYYRISKSTIIWEYKKLRVFKERTYHPEDEQYEITGYEI